MINLELIAWNSLQGQEVIHSGNSKVLITEESRYQSRVSYLMSIFLKSCEVLQQ